MYITYGVGCPRGIVFQFKYVPVVGSRSVICGTLCATTKTVGTGTNCVSALGAMVGVYVKGLMPALSTRSPPPPTFSRPVSMLPPGVASTGDSFHCPDVKCTVMNTAAAKMENAGRASGLATIRLMMRYSIWELEGRNAGVPALEQQQSSRAAGAGAGALVVVLVLAIDIIAPFRFL